MPNERSLIVGVGSAIGAALLRQFESRGVPVCGTSRRPGNAAFHIDLAAPACQWQLPPRVDTAYLCAAATSMDRCRTRPEESRRINVHGTLELAKRLRDRGAHLIFLSSNQVFDGASPRASAEAAPNPQSEYGRQKAEVESELLAAGQATIVRLTKVLGSAPPLLAEWAQLLRKGQAIRPFHDMVMAPIPLAWVAEALLRIRERQAEGIVQASGEMDVSYAELGCRLAERLRVDPRLVHPISTSERGLPAEAAPKHTTLCCNSLHRLGMTVPPVSDTLSAAIEGVVQG